MMQAAKPRLAYHAPNRSSSSSLIKPSHAVSWTRISPRDTPCSWTELGQGKGARRSWPGPTEAFQILACLFGQLDGAELFYYFFHILYPFFNKLYLTKSKIYSSRISAIVPLSLSLALSLIESNFKAQARPKRPRPGPWTPLMAS